VRLVGISYDPVEVLDRFVQRRKITFPLLSDPGSKTIRAYGLLNEEARGKAAGIPHPMTYVIDKDGIIRARLGRERYQVRHDIDELLAAVKTLNSTKQP